jgi:predicted DNA-binding transcriptional regulator AlpA
MTRLSISEASKKFGLSRTRLYKLLDMGKIDGFRSSKRGRNANSWVDADSLEKHISMRVENQKHGKGGPCIVNEDGRYVSVRLAAEKVGYTIQYVYRLAKRGSIGSKRPIGNKLGWLIDLADLERFRLKKFS